MVRRAVALVSTVALCLGCAPCRSGGTFPALGAPVFEGEDTVVELPEPWGHYAVGGAGRYVIFHLKDARKAVVLDLAEAKVVKEIPNVPDGSLVAAGIETLIIVVPSRRCIERWSLGTLAREKIAPTPTREPPVKALMGCAGTGPLLLASKNEARLVDIDTLKPLEVDGKVIGAPGRYGLVLDVSADGRTFTGIPVGIGAVPYTRMIVRGNRTRTDTFGSTSYAVRWARPSADGSVFFLPGGALYASSLQPLAAEWLQGSQCFPTPAAAFFLAVRFVTEQEGGGHVTRVDVCTTGDRRVVHTIHGLTHMAPRGNTSSRQSIARRLHEHAPRYLYSPTIGALASFHYDNRRITIERLDLLTELKATGKPYLFVTSVPPNVVRAGQELRYPIATLSSAGRLTYKLESAPAGAQVSRSGIVRWRVPSGYADEAATLITGVRGKGGLEVLHTVHVLIERRRRPPGKTKR
jgi:hypothetical protein